MEHHACVAVSGVRQPGASQRNRVAGVAFVLERMYASGHIRPWMPERLVAPSSEVVVKGCSMSDGRVVALRNIVCRDASGFDPSLLSGDDAALAMQQWAAIKHAASAAEALAAARVAECRPPAGSGTRDAADYVAKQTGTTKARATERIKTGTTLTKADATRAAATAGTLSAEQTAAVADAEAANPDAEQTLLDVADT